jgi:hypothetical protein
LLLNGYRVSVWDVKNALEVDSCYSTERLWM